MSKLKTELNEAYGYAVRFLHAFIENNGMTPVEPLPTLCGVLTQIDNATTIAKAALMSFKDPNDAPKADHTTGYKCDHCEHLHVALMDEDDRCIATAVIDRDMLENMLRIINDQPTHREIIQ